MYWWWWWWAWVAFLLLFLLLPLLYGWGRRDWGPPYPTYYRRRRYPRGAAAPEPRDVDPYDPTVPPMDDRLTAERDDIGYPGSGWSWLADLLWLGVLAAIGWGVYLWVT